MSTISLYKEYLKTTQTRKGNVAKPTLLLLALSGLILSKPDEATLHIAVYYTTLVLLARETTKFLIGTGKKIYASFGSRKIPAPDIIINHKTEIRFTEKTTTSCQEWILKTLL